MVGESKPASSPPKRQNSTANMVVVLVVLLAAAVVLGMEYRNGVFNTKPQVQPWTPPPPPTPMPLADVQEKIKRAEADKTIQGQGREHLMGYLQGELARSKAVAAGQPDPAMVKYQQEMAAAQADNAKVQGK